MLSISLLLSTFISLMGALPMVQASAPLVLTVESHRHIYPEDVSLNRNRGDTSRASFYDQDFLYPINKDRRLISVLEGENGEILATPNGFLRCDQQLLAPPNHSPAGNKLPAPPNILTLGPWGRNRLIPSPDLYRSHEASSAPLSTRQGFYAVEIVGRKTLTQEEIDVYLHLTQELDPDAVQFLTASRGQRMDSVLMLVSGQGYDPLNPRHALPFEREFRSKIKLSPEEFPYTYEIGRARGGNHFAELRALTGLTMAANLFLAPRRPGVESAERAPLIVETWIMEWLNRIHKTTVFVHATHPKLVDHYINAYGFKVWKRIDKSGHQHTILKISLADFLTRHESFSFLRQNWDIPGLDTLPQTAEAPQLLRTLGETLALKALSNPQFLQYTPGNEEDLDSRGNIEEYLPFEFHVSHRTQGWKAVMASVMTSFGFGHSRIEQFIGPTPSPGDDNRIALDLAAPEESRTLRLVFSALQESHAGNPSFDPRKALLGSSDVIYVSGFGSRMIPLCPVPERTYGERCSPGQSPLELYLSGLYKKIIEQEPSLAQTPANTQIAFFMANSNGYAVNNLYKIAKEHGFPIKQIQNPIPFNKQLIELWNRHGGIDRFSRLDGATQEQWWPDYARPWTGIAESISRQDFVLFPPENFYHLRDDMPLLPEWIITLKLSDLARVSRHVEERHAAAAKAVPGVLESTALMERYRRQRNSSL